MIILGRRRRGMDGPKEVDGKVIEGTFRAHQVPISMEKEKNIWRSWRRGCGVTGRRTVR